MPRYRVIRESAQLGRVIREARVQKGLTQERLADFAGIHRTYLSSVERGHRVLLLQRTLDLLHVLGLDLAVVERGQDA